MFSGSRKILSLFGFEVKIDPSWFLIAALPAVGLEALYLYLPDLQDIVAAEHLAPLVEHEPAEHTHAEVVPERVGAVGRALDDHGEQAVDLGDAARATAARDDHAAARVEERVELVECEAAAVDIDRPEDIESLRN